VDTLAIARGLHPGQRNNLDALCKRYEVDNSSRTLHGALVDCELLAQVYLGMTRGQDTLLIESGVEQTVSSSGAAMRQRPSVLRIKTSEADEALHRGTLEEIDRESRGNCLWNRLQAP
jgi:DNA polymerase-3 subunit epsilon